MKMKSLCATGFWCEMDWTCESNNDEPPGPLQRMPDEWSHDANLREL
jgi:hypothetical protein